MCAIKKITSIFLLTALFVLVACGSGGGSGTTAATNLSGTAAVGYGIVNGTVKVKCASNLFIANTTTTSSGSIQVDLSGQTLPCAIQVSGGTINGSANSNTYHSIATSVGNVNVTPLTDLLVANLAATTTPSIWFANLTQGTLAAITGAQISTATANVKTALGLTTTLSGIDPITSVFTPTRDNAMDNALEALATAMTNNGTTFTTLLNSAGAVSGATFNTPTGFNTALSNAYTAASAAPAVTSFTPSSGVPGTSVSITGTNFGKFTPSRLVKFGSTNAATPYTGESATNVTFTVPAGLAVGSYSLTIANADGTNAVTAGTFTVTAAPASGVTFSASRSGVSSVSNNAPAVTVSGGLTLLRYDGVTGTGGLLLTYQLASGTPYLQVNYGTFGVDITSINMGGGTTCALVDNGTGQKLCSTYGITFNKTAGTASFTATPMGLGLNATAPTLFTMTGNLTFTPF